MFVADPADHAGGERPAGRAGLVVAGKKRRDLAVVKGSA